MKHTDNTNRPPQKSVNQIVTERIIQSLSAGEIPWRQPWCNPIIEDTVNYITRRPYDMLNKMLLGKPGEYLTFEQIKKKKGHLKKGSKAKHIRTHFPVVPDSNKDEVKRLEDLGQDAGHLKKWIPKIIPVFSLDDTEGLKSLFIKNETKKAQNPTAMAKYVMNKFLADNKIKIDEKNCSECSYSPETRTITIPKKEQFLTEEEWYGTIYSQMVAVKEQEGSKTEDSPVLLDLISEMASSMILCGVNLERIESIQNTNAICTKWIRELGNDFKLLITASKRAEATAIEMLAGLAK